MVFHFPPSVSCWKNKQKAAYKSLISFSLQKGALCWRSILGMVAKKKKKKSICKYKHVHYKRILVNILQE